MTALTTSEDTARRYRLILDLARAVTAKLDLPSVLETTFASIRQMLDFTGGSIALVDDEGFLAFAATDPPATPEALTMRIPVGEGVSGRIAASGDPAYIPDILEHPSVTPERRKKATSSGVRSYFGLPLITEGRPIGVLQVDSTEVDAFSDEDRLLLLSFTPIIAAAVQNARVYAREAAAVEKLRELDNRHRDFVALVSHELRTPLTAVMGYADTIIAHHDRLNPDDVLALVHRTRRSAEHLATLVEQLLDLSVVQRGELRLNLSTVDMHVLLDEVVGGYGPLDRDIRVDSPADLPHPDLDAARMTQVLGNLLTNAVKFSPADQPIVLRARKEDDGWIAVDVIDRGVGIAPEDQPRIFERFVQLEPATVRRVGGFGLGLYVVEQLCAAMGAEISLESELGKGSTFTVRLPMSPPIAVRALSG